MPTLIGAAVLFLGGMVVWRVTRREWKRVNGAMQAQRAAKQAEAKDTITTLEQDPQTGAYRPKSGA